MQVKDTPLARSDRPCHDDQDQEPGIPVLRVSGDSSDRDLPDAVILEITDVGISRVELVAALYQLSADELSDWTPAEVRQFVVGTLMLGGREALDEQVWRVENPRRDTAAAVFLELCRHQIDTAFGLPTSDDYTYLDPRLSPRQAWERFRADHPDCRACAGDSPDCGNQHCACLICLDLARTNPTYRVGPAPAQAGPVNHQASRVPYESSLGWTCPEGDPTPATVPGAAPACHNGSRELAVTR